MESAALAAARELDVQRLAEAWHLSQGRTLCKLDRHAPLTICEVAAVAFLAGVMPSAFLD